MLREVSQSQREIARRQQETERLLTRYAQEAERSRQETDRHRQATDRRMRETDDLFDTPWSKFMEALAEGDLVTLLERRGIPVEYTMSPKKDHGEPRWEIDILAVNDDEVVVVAVKTTLKVWHVDDLLRLLKDFPGLLRAYRDHEVYGAVAYLNADESSAAYAQRQGLYVIRATGSSASITNPEDFQPRRFGRRSRVSEPR